MFDWLKKIFSGQKETGETVTEEPKQEGESNFSAPEAPQAPAENETPSPFQANDSEKLQ